MSEPSDKSDLSDLVPEFDLIQDADLRAKCVRVWEAAIQQGGWTVEDLPKIPFTLLIEKCPVSFLDHVRGVTLASLGVCDAAAKTYGDRLPLNRDILIAGGLLHDIGKLLEYAREGDRFVTSPNGKLLRHPFSGTALAAQFDVPDEVLHIIAVHAKEGDLGPRTPEAVIVHHCDFALFEPLRPPTKQ